MNRRELLKLGTSALVVAAMPMTALQAVAPPLPAWAVGVPDEWNWDAFHAATEHEARLQWVEGWCDPTCEQGGDAGREGCDCESCERYFSAEVMRRPMWDGKDVRPGSVEWFNADCGANCDRCGYETSRDECGQVVAGKIVCSDCLTIEDWRLIDPEYAAELEDEELV